MTNTNKRLRHLDIERDYLVDSAGCWIWQGYMDRNGYGKAYDHTVSRGRRTDWSHRVSYRRHKGEIPVGYEIDHVCQNTACINPEHLDAVTKIEHARRTWQRLGSDVRHADAGHLRKLGLTYAEIAELLGYEGKESAHAAVKTAIGKGLVSPDDVPRQRLLTEDDRGAMRTLYALGVPQTELATWFEVDNSQVSRICSGRTSGHSKVAAA